MNKTLDTITGIIGCLIFVVTSVAVVFTWWQYEDIRALIPIAIALVPVLLIVAVRRGR